MSYYKLILGGCCLSLALSVGALGLHAQDEPQNPNDNKTKPKPAGTTYPIPTVDPGNQDQNKPRMLRTVSDRNTPYRDPRCTLDPDSSQLLRPVSALERLIQRLAAINNSAGEQLHPRGNLSRPKLEPIPASRQLLRRGFFLDSRWEWGLPAAGSRSNFQESLGSAT
jgi:hypothetical protein